jgi:hypothetical protein
MRLMSTPRHRERFNGQYVSSVARYVPEYFAVLKDLTQDDQFWEP